MPWFNTLATQQRTAEDELLFAQAIWGDCHRTLQLAFSNGEVPHLFPWAASSWDCLLHDQLASGYVVQDLGDLTPSDSCVFCVEDPRVRLSDEVVRNGIVETLHEEEDDYLYMNRRLPNLNGISFRTGRNLQNVENEVNGVNGANGANGA
ncbi:hypothetical protein ABEF95_001191 [Exophiala dermatitidis]